MACEKCNMLINGVPMDVRRELERRAAANYRSLTGEVLAILSVVCRGNVALPGAVIAPEPAYVKMRANGKDAEGGATCQ